MSSIRGRSPFFLRATLASIARSYSGYAFMPPPQLGWIHGGTSMVHVGGAWGLIDLTVSMPRESSFGIMDRQIQECLAKRVADRQEKQRLKKEELKTSLARGVAAWSLADLKADCKLLDLPVSGNKGQLFSRLQGYVDGTVRPKKKRRR